MFQTTILAAKKFVSRNKQNTDDRTITFGRQNVQMGGKYIWLNSCKSGFLCSTTLLRAKIGG